jgi:hypothetical protein
MQCRERLQLPAVMRGVVVLLAQEDDVAAGHVGENIVRA